MCVCVCVAAWKNRKNPPKNTTKPPQKMYVFYENKTTINLRGYTRLYTWMKWTHDWLFQLNWSVFVSFFSTSRYTMSNTFNWIHHPYFELNIHKIKTTLFPIIITNVKFKVYKSSSSSVNDTKMSIEIFLKIVEF